MPWWMASEERNPYRLLVPVWYRTGSAAGARWPVEALADKAPSLSPPAFTHIYAINLSLGRACMACAPYTLRLL